MSCVGWLRWIGIALQVLGWSVVLLGVWDIYKAWRKAGRPPIHDRFTPLIACFRHAVLRRRELRSGTASMSAKARLAGSGYALPGPLPDLATDGERFQTAVQERLDKLTKELSEVRADLSTEVSNRARAIDGVKSEMDTTATTVDRRFDLIELGGLRTQFVGFVILTLATICNAIVTIHA